MAINSIYAAFDWKWIIVCNRQIGRNRDDCRPQNHSLKPLGKYTHNLSQFTIQQIDDNTNSLLNETAMWWEAIGNHSFSHDKRFNWNIAVKGQKTFYLNY